MILTLLFSILSFLSLSISSSEPTQRWMVELESDQSSCLKDWWKEEGLAASRLVMKKLPIERWWVIEIPGRKEADLKALGCITRIVPDQQIEWRLQPNDPAFINQQDMNLIGMAKAWDVATGGRTAQGDTIVVAVIDDGYQTDHEDLDGIFWKNNSEIPDDEQDNDGNGYADDYFGVNITTQNDQHPVRSHGTSVCGIIGAKGNNSKGVSGINWNIRIMLISGADFESDLIESYQYVVDQRRKYRQTNGAEGAFVVATNLSGGVNNAWAEDHPLWCGMYDELGEEGILNVCAAPNQGISVDEEGDMPTTCASPYMIAVTNVDLTDEILSNAGFGSTSIDIGAPGHGTITTASTNVYKEFPGTSAATPHVTGAIALMYSTPCESFLVDVKSDPEATASRVRDILFATAKPNNSLAEITTIGKRVQVDAAMEATIKDCGGNTASGISISSIRPNPAGPDGARVYFGIQGDSTDLVFHLYSATGALIYEIEVLPTEMEQGFLDLQTRSLPVGVYMLTLRQKDKKATRKLVIFL